jgi:uncharacterized protein (TIGR00299 family) protein
MGRTLYLECYSGISGDMTVGALLDLGAGEEALRSALAGLPVQGYELKIGRTKKCGMDACDFEVELDDQEHAHHHNHDSESGHDHDHSHHHNHSHHEQHRGHIHRDYRSIMEMLDQASLLPEVRTLAKKIFRIIGEAEAKVHGCPLETVHFHETGAVDSIVDIVGTAACVVDLGITDVYVSPLYEGCGHVWCQHGKIPVPAPAVAQISAQEGLELHLTDTKGEMVTPTGAGIAAALRTKSGRPESLCIEKIGIGAGKKDFAHANVLRAILLTDSEGKKKRDREDEIWILETNLDDATGETLGFVMERLFEAGVRDVSYTPIYMKKNRPAWRLEVLCKEPEVEKAEEIIFLHTTAIGLRKRKEIRRILPRKIVTVRGAFGEAKVKISLLGDLLQIYPEYESVREIVQKTGRPYQEVYREITEEAWKQREDF